MIISYSSLLHLLSVFCYLTFVWCYFDVSALDISKYHHLESFVTLQLQYNLLDRGPELELLKVAEKENLAVLAWSPLAAGWLTGKYKRGQLTVCLSVISLIWAGLCFCLTSVSFHVFSSFCSSVLLCVCWSEWSSMIDFELFSLTSFIPSCCPLYFHFACSLHLAAVSNGQKEPIELIEIGQPFQLSEL